MTLHRGSCEPISKEFSVMASHLSADDYAFQYDDSKRVGAETDQLYGIPYSD